VRLLHDSPASAHDDFESALRAVRDGFVRAFPERLASAAVMTRSAKDPRESDDLIRLVHQLAGLAGSVGFPTVSERAQELQLLLATGSDVAVDVARVEASLGTLGAAFAIDEKDPPSWALAPQVSTGAKVLFGEHDPVLRDAIAVWLTDAGHTPISLAAGDNVLEVARLERPGAILLDTAMPIDGGQILRELRASVDLSLTPVILVGAVGNLEERLAALVVGADDYLEKPFESRELVTRISNVLSRSAATMRAVPLLDYRSFLAAADRLLRTHEAAIVVIRLPLPGQSAIVNALIGELRRCDLAGRCDANHLVLAMPGLEPAVARLRSLDLIQRLHLGSPAAGLNGGIAPASLQGERRIESLVMEAKEALAEARNSGEPGAVNIGRVSGFPNRQTVILADDDEQLVHLIGTRVRAAGHHTVLAFDGQQALDAVLSHEADLLVIDLSMPKLSGFDVLERLGQSNRLPPTIVLSGHRKSDDVSRAIGLGASDYILKPFSPQQLMRRLALLLGSQEAAT